MDEKTLEGHISSLRDEIDRVAAQIRPGSYNRISPQKEKGDLAVWGNKKSLCLKAGDNGQVLMIDPQEDSGMKWVDPSALSGIATQLIVPFNQDGSADSSWGSMPLAEAFLFSDHRHVTKVDLTNYTQVRLIVNQQANGVGNAVLELQYHTSLSATASTYSTIGDSTASILLGGSPTIHDSGWIDLLAAARDDVFLAIIGSGGNGVLSPNFGAIQAHFRVA